MAKDVNKTEEDVSTAPVIPEGFVLAPDVPTDLTRS